MENLEISYEIALFENSYTKYDNSSKGKIELNNSKFLGAKKSEKIFENKELMRINYNKKIMKLTDFELNNLTYDEALKTDKRTYINYYFSLIRTKHILFTFFSKHDYNSLLIKISFFLFSFTLYYTVNALFFNDSTMHRIKEDGGLFNLNYQIPYIIYSSLISSTVNSLIKTFSSTESNIVEIKNEKDIKNLNKKSESVKKCIFIKSLCFYISTSVLLLFFWYYLSCFSAIYKNTQLHLIKDTLISFGLSLIYPFGIYLIPGIFRISALRKSERKFMFKLSKILQFI